MRITSRAKVGHSWLSTVSSATSSVLAGRRGDGLLIGEVAPRRAGYSGTLCARWRCRRPHLGGRRAGSAAVVRRAQMGAALDYPARDVRPRLAGGQADFSRGDPRVLGCFAGIWDGADWAADVLLASGHLLPVFSRLGWHAALCAWPGSSYTLRQDADHSSPPSGRTPAAALLLRPAGRKGCSMGRLLPPRRQTPAGWLACPIGNRP